jgi:hypothetical protein
MFYVYHTTFLIEKKSSERELNLSALPLRFNSLSDDVIKIYLMEIEYEIMGWI